MKAPTKYIVTLHWPTPRAVPKFGQFLWSPEHGKLVWRNEIAETTGQLAELINQALPFVRDQMDQFLWVEVLQVKASADCRVANAESTEGDIIAETDIEKLRSLVVSLRQANEEKQVVIDRLSGEEEPAEPIVIDADVTSPLFSPEANQVSAAAAPALQAQSLSDKIASLPRKKNKGGRPRKVTDSPFANRHSEIAQ